MSVNARQGSFGRANVFGPSTQLWPGFDFPLPAQISAGPPPPLSQPRFLSARPTLTLKSRANFGTRAPSSQLLCTLTHPQSPRLGITHRLGPDSPSLMIPFNKRRRHHARSIFWKLGVCPHAQLPKYRLHERLICQLFFPASRRAAPDNMDSPACVPSF